MNTQAYISQILDELSETVGHICNDSAEKLADAILAAETIFVAGAGRSGLAMKSFAMRLMHMGFDTYVVGETVTPNITDKDVLLIGSGSGSTNSLVINANKADAIGATICLITIDENSPIAQVAEVILTIPAPSPKVNRDLGFRSVQPMGSLFEQSLLLTLEAIVLLLMRKTGKTTELMFTRHANLE
ncbi:6-phospho-3-hexuloisomerase [Candidatus Poribacteria bacterium]|nr:6-phospho-3-hexuloisomerase [Candidatus Poribacteria bacterium]